MKKEKLTDAYFAVTPHTAKVINAVHDKCLAEKKNALTLWVEDMNRKYVPIDGNGCARKRWVYTKPSARTPLKE